MKEILIDCLYTPENAYLADLKRRLPDAGYERKHIESMDPQQQGSQGIITSRIEGFDLDSYIIIFS